MTRTKKTPRRVLSWLLVLMMTLTLLPTMAVPALAVGGNDYTLVLKNSDGSWCKDYDGGTAVSAPSGVEVGGQSGAWTLTLNNFSFSTSALTALTVPAGTTIVLEADSANTITSTSSNQGANGIYSPGALTITGEGTLTASAANTAGLGAGITAGNGTLTISGGTVIATSSVFGIATQSGNLAITGGTVTATGGASGAGTYGIMVGGNFTFTGGTVYAKGYTNSVVVVGTAPTGVIIMGESGGDYNVPGQFGTSTINSTSVNVIVQTAEPGIVLTDAKITLAPVTLYVGNGSAGYSIYTQKDGTTLSVPYTENLDKWSVTQPDGKVTLTLTNFNFTTSADKALVFAFGATIDVVLNDTNTIESTSSSEDACGISFANIVPLNVSGSGSLTVTATTAIDTSNGSFVIKSGTVNAIGTKIGLKKNATPHYTVISGGTLTATGDTKAIDPEYTVPNGYKYWTGTDEANADIGGEASIGNGTDTTVGTEKYVKIEYAVPPASDTLYFRQATGGSTYSLYTDASENTEYTTGKDTTWSVSGTTLTLSGFNFETTAATALQINPNGTKIVLADGSTNTITSTHNGDASYGIEAKGALTISGGTLGTGILNATGGTAVYISAGIYVGTEYLTMNGGTVTATGGVVTADESYPMGSYGVLFEDIIMNAGTLKGVGGTASINSAGIAGALIIINGGTIEATGDTSSSSYGIRVNHAFNINGGTTIAKGNTQAILLNGDNTTLTGTYQYRTGAYGETLSGDWTDWLDPAAKNAVTGATTYQAQLKVPTLYFGQKNTGESYTLYTNDELTIPYTGNGGDGGGKWSGSSEADKTLTLNGFIFGTEDAIALKMSPGTTINTTGTNTITSTNTTSNSPYPSGIVAFGELKFTGSGTLNVSAKSYGISSESGNLAISGGTVNATGTGTGGGYPYGVKTGNLTVSGGTLTATGDTNLGTGISVTGNFALTGGTVYAKGGTNYYSVYISDTGTAPTGVTIKGKDGSDKYTIDGAFGNLMDLSRTPGAPAKTIYSAADNTVVLLDVKITKTTINPPTPDPDPEPTPTPTPAPPASTVIVDGKEISAGEVTKSGDTTTVTVKQDVIQKQIETATSNVTVVVPSETGTAVATLVVQNVDDMAGKDMTLTVQVGNVQYEIPTAAMDTSAILAALGADNAADVPISITITTDMSAAAQAAVDAAIAANGNELVFPPIEFKITATYEGRTYEVDTFSQYVSRAVEITAEQAGRITTAIVVDPDGTTRQVPTRVYQSGGKWYAEVNSLTNSTYAFVNNVKTFTDAKGKWYEAAVNEMGSRMIISGIGDNLFAGDNDITRAEFAAILIRALGLPANGNGSVFTDVSRSAWYAGAVGTAYEYGLVTGVGNNQFAPDKKITRQEAMAMIQRAAKIAGFNGSNGSLSAFTDADGVSDWAQSAAQWNVGSGLIQGSNGKLNPVNNITRAETATLVLKLLQKAGLVDVRTQF